MSRGVFGVHIARRLNTWPDYKVYIRAQPRGFVRKYHTQSLSSSQSMFKIVFMCAMSTCQNYLLVVGLFILKAKYAYRGENL